MDRDTPHIPANYADDSRGQLIISGGVLLAALILIIAAILSGIVLTDTTATQSDLSVTSMETHETVSTLSTHLEYTMEREHSERHQSSGVAAAAISTQTSPVSDALARQQFRSGNMIVSITPVETQQAWLITQASDSKFRASPGVSDRENWVLATSDGIRESRLTVTSARQLTANGVDQAADVFKLSITGAGGTGARSTVYLFTDTTGNVSIGTQTDSENNPIVACSTSETPAHIDFSRGELNGEPCNVTLGEGVSSRPYELSYENGGEITGTYTFIAGRNGSTTQLGDGVRDTVGGDSPLATEPTAYDGVYSSTLGVTVKSESTRLTTELRVAPGEHSNTTSRTELPGDGGK